MMRVAAIVIVATMTCLAGLSNGWAQGAPKPLPPAAAKKPQPQPAAKQGIPIVIQGSSETQQADAALVLAINLTFAGSQGGNTQPSVDVIDPATGAVIEKGFSNLAGVSGLAGATGAVTLPFSGMYRKKGEPLRIYFKLDKGDLQLWWSAQAKAPPKNQNTLAKLSPAWLAASTELPAAADHPAGGIKISSPAPNGQPLAFFLDFTETKTLMPAPSVKAMGTE